MALVIEKGGLKILSVFSRFSRHFSLLCQFGQQGKTKALDLLHAGQAGTLAEKLTRDCQPPTPNLRT
jgi:hypothetical protein